MKVTEHIRRANGKTLFSIEILPPVKGRNIQETFEMLDTMMEYNPAFIDVTYHREEYVYKKRSDGLLEKKIVHKRPGTVAICSAIQNHYKIDAVPHVICGGFTKDDIENVLIELNFLGIDNILVLRGDPIKPEGTFVPEPDGHAFASDLLEQVMDLNKGKYLDEHIQNSLATDFCVGVAGYPEKHFEAPNLNIDLQYLKKKVDAGAEYVVTQMFFDNQKYFEFVDKCREIGINVPIIPGIKPLTTISQITVLPKIFHVDLPDALANELVKAKSNSEVREIGIEWCINQCKELIEKNAPVLHFYTMSRSETINKVLKEVF